MDERFDDIAGRATVGHLGILTPDGYPRVIAVNFVHIGERIYLHGADTGEKFDVFKGGCKVTFEIDLPYALIPSYWRSETYACPASQYYKSMLIKGRGAVVSDPMEKAEALQALMEKHQPEGRFTPITPDDSLYRKALDEVAILRIDPEQIDIKEKFGEHLPRATRSLIVENLRRRGGDIDLATADEIERRLQDKHSDEEAE
jgi:nitroimidazol reductase NimA-like FMN-containing flavoprotein (pyridoxamine 5'-phosphate oxidase superfamily)